MRGAAWIAVFSLALSPSFVQAVPAPECVEPHVDILRLVTPTAPYRLDFARVADLDGDRRRDLLLWDFDSCGSGGCDYHVYLTNRGCDRYAGWFRGSRPAALDSRHAGVRDMRFFEHGGSNSWTEGIGEHDGHVYRVRERDCICASECEPPQCTDFHPRAP